MMARLPESLKVLARQGSEFPEGVSQEAKNSAERLAAVARIGVALISERGYTGGASCGNDGLI